MKKEELAKDIYETILTVDQEGYKSIFETANIEKIKDPYWKDAVNLYNELDEKNKHILMRIINQSEIDGVAAVLGFLDGVSSLNKLGALEVEIKHKDSNEILNGDLQDIFLELVESNNQE